MRRKETWGGKNTKGTTFKSSLGTLYKVQKFPLRKTTFVVLPLTFVEKSDLFFLFFKLVILVFNFEVAITNGLIPRIKTILCNDSLKIAI